MRSHEIGKSGVIKRTFSSAGRLAICGFPVTALDEVLGSDRGPVEARENTLVGQGFHLLFTIVPFTIMRWRSLGPRQPCKRISAMAPQNSSCVDACMGQFSSMMLSLLPWIDHCRDLVEDHSGVVRCDEDVLWLHNPGSESLVSESLESVTTSLLVAAKRNTYVCPHCCNLLSILLVKWTTIPNLWLSVKQS